MSANDQIRSSTPPPSPGSLPARLIVVCLLLLLPLAPPEARGEAMAGSALLVALVCALVWSRSARRGGGSALLLLGGALALPAAWTAAAPAAAVEPVGIALLAGAAGLAAFGLREDGRLVRRALGAVALAGSWLAAHALYQTFWGLEAMAARVKAAPLLPDHQALMARLEGGRAFATFATPAALGGFLALALPITLAFALDARGWRRRLGIAAALLQLGGLVAAASATALAALIGAAAVTGLASGRARRAVLAWLAVLLVLLAIVAGLRGDKVLRPTDPDSAWRLRAGNARSALAMASDHPWTGVGPGGFGEMYPGYRRPGDNETRHAHNLPLELAAELGWPAGMLVAFLFFHLLLRPAWHGRGSTGALRRAGALGLVAFALQNLADFTSFMPSLLWSAALVAGLLAPRRDGRDTWEVSRAVAGCSLAVVIVAACVVGLSGLSRDAHRASRRAAFERDTGRAADLARRAVSLAPWSVDAAVLQARITTDEAVHRGDDASLGGPALEQADRAVALSPVRPSARELRAAIRLRTGDAPGAYADLSRAAQLYPLRREYAESRDRVGGWVEPGGPGRVPE